MLSPLLRPSTIPIQFSAPDRPTEWPLFSFEVERSLPQPRVDGSSSWFGKRGHTWGERNRARMRQNLSAYWRNPYTNAYCF